MISIELSDVQGLIVKGYGRMHNSRYVMLHVTNAAATKAWIHSISPLITDATHLVTTNCLNIAFTSKGLSAIEMSGENIQNFSREFSEGMYTPHRQRLLGDYDGSQPGKWNWGGPDNEELHILLLIFGATEELTTTYYEKLKLQFSAAGLRELGILDGQTLPENKEHFGFRDGIAQPIIEGTGRTGHTFNTVATGEFIMGYKNEYGVFPDTPIITNAQGNMNLLPADVSGTGHKDIGRNGSYMVVRQMQQDVEAFWKFMNEKTKSEDGKLNTEESIRLASKMMGRWPSGTPLVSHPDKDPGILTDDDSFEYADDKEGMKCPFGAHIRRINPRDTFEENGSKESLILTKRHRILRRGRLYGTPFEGSPENFKPDGEVGLLFLCFNADIGKQFEFLSYTWGNYPNVKELYADPDPIIGVREIPMEGYEQNFTIQGKPASQCISGLQRFITIKGGAYFFFPSKTVIRYLATI
ncbi:MAG: Dyp-type peroxidase [Chitinophagaceae bacterium]